MKKLPFALLVCAVTLWPHPMGNFSISHYARFEATPQGIRVEYALDFAEIPTMELLRTWGLERTFPRRDFESKAFSEAGGWFKHLTCRINGRSVAVAPESVSVVISDGAGDLPVMRVVSRARIRTAGGRFEYADENFPDRAGWKEIVIASGPGAVVRTASHSDRDLSKALTQYPTDPAVIPPQDLRAVLNWRGSEQMAAGKFSQPDKASTGTMPKAVITPVPQPRQAMKVASPATLTAQAAPLGSLARGDFLSRLLGRRDVTLTAMLAALAVAFLLGAGHALTPGHGKTVVAAYLVGSRGTLKHAAFLGAMVTLTHTITVFALGLATLFLFQFVMPEKITQWLGAVSGLSIVILGAWMLYKRIQIARHQRAHRLGHAHQHHHEDGHHHHHDDHAHHHHGSGGHSHVPADLSLRGLMALGVSGGLVPCESALVLLLGAVALNRVGLGLLLLLAFSAGLASVLTAVGALFVYAKSLFPANRFGGESLLVRWASIASPAVVILVGLFTTAASVGFQP